MEFEKDPMPYRVDAKYYFFQEILKFKKIRTRRDS